MRFLGLAIIIGIVWAIIGQEHAGLLLDIPSFIIILGLPLGMLLFGRAPLGTMFSALWSADADPRELEAAARGWGLARRYTVAAAVIGAIVGGVIMLAVAEDLSGIGPGAAISMLVVAYAAFFGYGIYLPLQSRLEDRAKA